MTKITPSLFVHLLFVLTLSCFSSFSYAQASFKIIGGKTSDSSQWPWMAGLVKKNLSDFDGVYCGASLIAKQWVLTAAHCVEDESAWSIDVIINRANLKRPTGERLSVERIILHPLYKKSTFDNDIALVKLRSPSVNTPITFLSPYSSQDKADKPVIALGWGTTSATEDIYPANLQQIDLSVLNQAICSATIFGITDDMFCAGVISGTKDTCNGDSGGPLITFDTESNSWRQVGITSWGLGCAVKGLYGVYTRVKNYASFISDNICIPDEKPATPSLSLNINANIVSTIWSSPSDDNKYRLNFAPFPHPDPIYSVDLTSNTQFSVPLNKGDAYYVAITSYRDNCTSGFSNIEHFVIQ